MTRVIRNCLIAALFLTSAALVEAQQPAGKVPRLGFLTTGSRPGATSATPAVEALRQGLRDLGHVEGKNIYIEYRFAEGSNERLSELLEELIRLKIDVLIVSNATVARVAKKATTTIPIVAANMGRLDGLVDSLAHPGGNVTGLTHISIELLGKRLGLLKESVPKVSRFAFLDDSVSGGYKNVAKETERTATALGVQLQILEVIRSNPGLDSVFQTMVKERIGAFMIEATPNVNFHRKQILALAEKHHIPAIHSDDSWPNDGGLMSYGANRVEPYRRIAVYVDKILKGAKPAELPVEQPTKFEFVINLKAAKQIGLTIPPEVLARANRIIR